VSLGHPSKFQRVSRLRFVTAPTSLKRRSTKLCTMFGRLMHWYTMYALWELLPPNRILPAAKFTLRPSLTFSYMGSVTARHSSSGQTLWRGTTNGTRHRASTSMYSLTFCVRVMSPERHHWKPAVQTAAVMLRTPPVDGQSPASQPRPLTIYSAQF